MKFRRINETHIVKYGRKHNNIMKSFEEIVTRFGIHNDTIFVNGVINYFYMPCYIGFMKKKCH